MRWLAFGTYDARRHPRIGVLIAGLRAAGDVVEELNAPLRVDTADRVAAVREPWRLLFLAFRLLSCWVDLLRRARSFRKSPGIDVVLVGYLGHLDVHLARRVFPHVPIALDFMVSLADVVADRRLDNADGIRSRTFRVIDERAISQADVVVVDTSEHAADLPARVSRRTAIVPVGAGAEWFAARVHHRHRSPEKPLRVIFFGVFTPLHGAQTIAEALALLDPGEAVAATMVGTGQDYQASRAACLGQQVRWLDWLPPEELPILVSAHDVCLGIFGTTSKAYKVVPTKVFQGAAAGCAIVTSDTPPQRRVLGDAAIFVPPGDPEALAFSLRSLAADRRQLERLRMTAQHRADASFAPAIIGADLRRQVRASLDMAGHPAMALGE